MVGNVGLEKYFDLDEHHRFYKNLPLRQRLMVHQVTSAAALEDAVKNFAPKNTKTFEVINIKRKLKSKGLSVLDRLFFLPIFMPISCQNRHLVIQLS